MATAVYAIKNHYKDDIAGQWDMVHDLINAIRSAKGLTLSTEVNPHNGKVGKRAKKTENEY